MATTSRPHTSETSSNAERPATCAIHGSATPAYWEPCPGNSAATRTALLPPCAASSMGDRREPAGNGYIEAGDCPHRPPMELGWLYSASLEATQRKENASVAP